MKGWMWPVQNRRQNEFHNFYWQVTSVGMCDCFYENDQIFKDGAPPHGILLGFCSKLLKSLSDTFLHVFWPVLTDLRQFEIHKIFDFLGEKGEKSFSRSENYFLRKCIIPTTIWKHISNISKAQIRREKKVNYPRSWFRIFSRNSSKKVLGVTNIKNKIRADKEHAKILRIWAYHIFSRILTNLCEFLAKRTAQIFFSNLPRFLFKNWRLD